MSALFSALWAWFAPLCGPWLLAARPLLSRAQGALPAVGQALLISGVAVVACGGVALGAGALYRAGAAAEHQAAVARLAARDAEWDAKLARATSAALAEANARQLALTAAADAERQALQTALAAQGERLAEIDRLAADAPAAVVYSRDIARALNALAAGAAWPAHPRAKGAS